MDHNVDLPPKLVASFQLERRPQSNAQGLPHLAKMAHHAAPQGLPQRLADELDAARKAAAEACTAFLADTTLSMHTVARAFNELQQSAAAAAVSNSGAPVDATFAVRPDVKGDVRPTTAARLVELHNVSPQGLWALIVLDFGRQPPYQVCDWPAHQLARSLGRLLCVVVAGKLGVADVLALAPTLGKLVALTSLNLARTLRSMRVVEVQDTRRLELRISSDGLSVCVAVRDGCRQ